MLTASYILQHNNKCPLWRMIVDWINYILSYRMRHMWKLLMMRVWFITISTKRFRSSLSLTCIYANQSRVAWFVPAILQQNWTMVKILLNTATGPCLPAILRACGLSVVSNLQSCKIDTRALVQACSRFSWLKKKLELSFVHMAQQIKLRSQKVFPK